MNNQTFFNYNLFADNLARVTTSSKKVISTINPFSFLIAEKDTYFKNALQNSEILLPDGEGIVWATKFLHKKEIKKIAGYDIFIHLMNKLQEQKGSCFFFGSSEETLVKIKNKAAQEYPSVEVNYFSPPFKDAFSEEENAEFTSFINSKNPNVLFVGMTAPKQEKWVFKNREKLNVPVIASIGAVFNFYAGNEKRAHPLLIKFGLEWVARSIQSPDRLGRRNLYAIPRFIFHIIKHKLKHT